MLGWAFLVGPGRRRDFSTLLAPDFLVAERGHGVLTDVVTARDDETGTVLPITTAGGRRLTLVFRTHLVTGPDLTPELAQAGGIEAGSVETAAEPPRDEHSRPLRLAYGFAVPDAQVVEPAEADLAQALAIGLDVYRRFLKAEEDFAVHTSTAFELQSRTAGAASAVTASRVPASGTSSRPSTGSRSNSASLLAADRRPIGLLVAGALAVAAVIAGLLLASVLGGGSPKAPGLIVTPSQTPSPSPSRTTSVPFDQAQ